MPRPLINQEKIIEAALFCAFDKGMGDTSLNDISNYLSIKKASLYNHFASKEDMLNTQYGFENNEDEKSKTKTKKLLKAQLS